MATKNDEFNSNKKQSNTHKLTPEKMILKTPSSHEFVNEQPLIIFDAVSDQLNEVRMMKLSEKINLSLFENKIGSEIGIS